MNTLVDELKDLIIPIISKNLQKLVDIEILSENKNRIIRVIVGSKKGPTVDDLTKINREFNQRLIEVGKEEITEKYSIEISSPGLDRPLKTIEDFDRNLERWINLSYLNELDKKITNEAQIVKINDNSIVFNIKKSKKEIEKKEIDLQKIRNAKIIVKF